MLYNELFENIIRATNSESEKDYLSWPLEPINFAGEPFHAFENTLFERILREADEIDITESNVCAVKETIHDFSYNYDGDKKIMLSSNQYKNIDLAKCIDLYKKFQGERIFNRSFNNYIEITTQGLEHIRNPNFNKSSDQLLIIMILPILLQNTKFSRPEDNEKIEEKPDVIKINKFKNKGANKS